MVAASVAGAGSGDDAAVERTAGVALAISTTLTERLTKLLTNALVPVLLIAMPRGALPTISLPPTLCRSARTIALGPATSGAPIVGIPNASTVSRTIRSEFWMTTHASAPSGRQAIATGFVRKRRG